MLKVPQELGVGPGTTCWRRLKRWIDAGVFDQLHQILLERLNTGNRIDWSRAAMDGNHIDAKKGLGTGPSPVNRASPVPKHHLICDGNGTPIYVLTSGANIPRLQPRPRAARRLPAYCRPSGPATAAFRRAAGRVRRVWPRTLKACDRCTWSFHRPTRSTASGPHSNPGRPSWRKSAQRGRLAQQH